MLTRDASGHVLLTSQLNFGISAVTFLVDSDVVFSVLLIAAWTVVSVGDVDLFLRVPSIFPSDARGLGQLDFPFYFCDSSFLGGSVTPVR